MVHIPKNILLHDGILCLIFSKSFKDQLIYLFVVAWFPFKDGLIYETPRASLPVCVGGGVKGTRLIEIFGRCFPPL
jgi:hypothetical protein